MLAAALSGLSICILGRSRFDSAFGKPVVLAEKQTLTGGDVLPGFRLQLRKLFAFLDDMQ